MRRWEWVFPITAVVLPLWASIPDLLHHCGFWEWSFMCGIGAIFRFDVLVPMTFPLALWALWRTR